MRVRTPQTTTEPNEEPIIGQPDTKSCVATWFDPGYWLRCCQLRFPCTFVQVNACKDGKQVRACASAMKNLSDFALEQHRVYVLRHFELESNGDIVCSAYARSNPDKIIAARFPQAILKSEWQEHERTSKLPWPLEVISFHAVRLGRRFRFTLNCVDFEREWESEWPQLI